MVSTHPTVAALLRPHIASRLSSVLATGWNLEWSADAAEFEQKLRKRHFDAILIEPACDGTRLPGEAVSVHLRRAIGRSKLDTLVLVVGVNAADMRSVLDYAVLGVSDLIVLGVDDHVSGLQVILARSIGSKLRARVLHEISDELARLPLSLSGAIKEVFSTPIHFETVEDLASRARLQRRSVDRWLMRGKLASGRVILSCAHAVAAYRMLRAQGAQLTLVANSMRYASVRALAADIRTAADCSPRMLRSAIAPDDLVARVVRRMRRIDTDGAPPVLEERSTHV